MKKLIALILCLTLALALAACSQGGTGKQPGESEDPSDNLSDTPSSDTSDEPSDEPSDELSDEPSEGDTPTPPPFAGGIGGIGGIGGGGSDVPDIPVADPGDLVDQLDAICRDIVEGSYCAAPRSSSDFNNYFTGSVQYTEGLRVAMNHLEMAPPAHIVMLIEVPEGQNAEDYAKELYDNANPRWLVCATANSVQYAVKGNLVLFVMSNEDTANAVIAAFNG